MSDKIIWTMTTFQYLIDAALSALSQIIPISYAVVQDVDQNFLHWSNSPPELSLLVTIVGSLCFLAYFRFDWLGLFSASLKSIFRPQTLKADQRSLDQHTVIFLLIVCLPRFLLAKYAEPFMKEGEILTHPFVMAAGFFLVFFGFTFASLRNKRIKGLNHLKLADSFFISGAFLLSLHPAIPMVFTLWAAFALMNYHFETIYKYTSLIIGLHLFIQFFSLSHNTGFKSAFDTIGHLNSLAVIVVLFTIFWMTMEHLQKTLNDQTFKTFRWINFLCACFYIALYFLK